MFAKSLKEIENNFNKYGATCFNFVFIDNENIGYYAPPMIPIRKNVFNGP